MLCYRVHPKIAFRVMLLAAGCFLAVCAALPTMAQPRAATVNSFNGKILVVPASQPLSPQAQSARMSQAGVSAILTVSGDVREVSSPQPILLPQPGKTVLGGYRIVVKAGASATLTLPDGSQIYIREMSIVELNGFTWDPQANLRGMLMSLYAGAVRVVMARAVDQGSFFEIKTPNAFVALYFSQPDVEVIYAPSPLGNMAALLEEGVALAAAEENLWKDVLLARKEDALRRQRAQRARTQTAALSSGGRTQLPASVAQLSRQETLAQMGMIQSEEEPLLQARRLQREEQLAGRLPPKATKPQGAAGQAADASTPALFRPASGGLPSDIAREQWQDDGLIVGEEDDAGKGTTFVFAYTASAIFMNRLTRETRTIQPGQRAVARGPGITMTVLNGNPMQQDPPRNMGTVFALDSQGQMNRPEESFIQNREDASASAPFPGATGRPDSSGRPRPHHVEIVIEE